MASSTLGFFDGYNPKVEAKAIDDASKEDSYGTSFFIDLTVHLLETYFALTVVSTVVVYAIATLFEWL